MNSFKLLLLLILYSQISFCQKFKSEFFSDANGTIYKRKVNAIGFRTPNLLDSFYNTLKKTFGSPIRDVFPDGMLYIYKCYNRQWAKDKIIIRVAPSVDINLDSSKLNDIFIFVETKHRVDLLNHKRRSYKKINNFFISIFNKTIRNAKPDNFSQFYS